MAVSSLVNRNDYIGAASTATYPYGFRIFENTNLQVIVRVIATGVETTLTLTTHYTVSGVGDLAGGNVVLVNGGFAWQNGSGFLLSTYAISIRRVMPLTQTTPFRNLASFFPESHEDALDKLAMISQQQQDQINESIRMAASIDPTTFNPEIPASYSGANRAILMLNSSGNGLESTPYTLANLIAAINVGLPFTIGRAIQSNAVTGLAEASSVTNTELAYLSGVTSALQTQLNAKQDTITGAASTVVSSNLTASRAVISGASGKLATTAVTHTELDYLSGVTSAIQTQLNSKASSTFTAPTVQRFTSGSGTYTKPANVLYIQVEMVGGGGGGQGTGTSGAGNGTDGGSTTFGSSLVTLTGGIKGSAGAINIGGTSTVNSPATALVSISGAAGGPSITSAVSLSGGAGAGTPFTGPVFANSNSGAGRSNSANSGGGGAGGFSGAASFAGGEGGGAGGYAKFVITNPSATYSYAVGAGGTGGVAGVAGYVGGNGGSGVIIVTEFYQ